MSWQLKVTHIWVTFFSLKVRVLHSFQRFHILPGIEKLVILGKIIGREKLCWH